jgi:hypothetical protein
MWGAGIARDEHKAALPAIGDTHCEAGDNRIPHKPPLALRRWRQCADCSIGERFLRVHLVAPKGNLIIEKRPRLPSLGQQRDNNMSEHWCDRAQSDAPGSQLFIGICLTWQRQLATARNPLQR